MRAAFASQSGDNFNVVPADEIVAQYWDLDLDPGRHPALLSSDHKMDEIKKNIFYVFPISPPSIKSVICARVAHITLWLLAVDYVTTH